MDPRIENQEETFGKERPRAPGTTDGAANDGGQAREAAQQAGRDIKNQAADAQQRAKEAGRQTIEQGKQRVGEELGVYSKAIHRAAESLEKESEPSAATLLHRAAEALDGAQKRIDQRDLKGLLRDAENVIRENPQVAFGGLFIAGVAAARFLRASAEPARSGDGISRGASDASQPQTDDGSRPDGGFRSARESRSGAASATSQERTL